MNDTKIIFISVLFLCKMSKQGERQDLIWVHREQLQNIKIVHREGILGMSYICLI